MDKIKRILIISADKSLKDVLQFCFDGWGYEVFLEDFPLKDTKSVKKILPDVIVADIQTAHKDQLHICQLLKDDFITAFIPIITIINKRQLRQQLLDIRQGVDDYLIKPPDPLDLRVRIEMALRRSQYSFYTNSLTGLPGSRIIEDIVNEKIKKQENFVFAYVDIDNFKAFNDVYGYVRGDQVLMHTAYLLYSSLKHHGSQHDFIGHIGGDDFVFITQPAKYKSVCEDFIRTFDRIMPFHYDPEDRSRGYVFTTDRSNTKRQIPIMSLSIAVVQRNHANPLKSLIEINDRLSEIKKYLKVIPKSKYMADRRSPAGVDTHEPAVNDQQQKVLSFYKPLGQLLVEENVITDEQLNEALRINWKKGIMLGEVLKDMGYIKDDQLHTALMYQRMHSSEQFESRVQ